MTPATMAMRRRPRCSATSLDASFCHSSTGGWSTGVGAGRSAAAGSVVPAQLTFEFGHESRKRMIGSNSGDLETESGCGGCRRRADGDHDRRRRRARPRRPSSPPTTHWRAPARRRRRPRPGRSRAARCGSRRTTVTSWPAFDEPVDEVGAARSAWTTRMRARRIEQRRQLGRQGGARLHLRRQGDRAAGHRLQRSRRRGTRPPPASPTSRPGPPRRRVPHRPPT